MCFKQSSYFHTKVLLDCTVEFYARNHVGWVAQMDDRICQLRFPVCLYNYFLASPAVSTRCTWKHYQTPASLSHFITKAGLRSCAPSTASSTALQTAWSRRSSWWMTSVTEVRPSWFCLHLKLIMQCGPYRKQKDWTACLDVLFDCQQAFVL